MEKQYAIIQLDDDTFVVATYTGMKVGVNLTPSFAAVGPEVFPDPVQAINAIAKREGWPEQFPQVPPPGPGGLN